MARSSTAAAPKKPGRVKQFWQVFTMTRREDPAVLWWVIGVFVGGIAVGLLLAFTIGAGNWFAFVLYIIIGVMLGLLGSIIVIGRRAERAAYARIETQPGSVGVVLRSTLRRGWTGSELPVAVNARTRDTVFRAVGRPGVVLIAQGPTTRTQRLVEDERRKVNRVAPNVPVAILHVNTDADGIKLHQINRRLGKLKAKLTRAEVLAVSHRLDSLTTGPAIPKGVDPTKIRPVRR